MKIKIKLSIIMIAIVVFMIGGIVVLLLRQAYDISMNLNIRGIDLLADQQTTFWKGQGNRYMDVLRMTAAIMSQYESVPTEQRRQRYDDVMLAALNSQPGLVRVFSVWKPNAMDGMDSRYIGRRGSTAAGQYAMTWNRDTDQIMAITNPAANEITAWLNGPNAHNDLVEDISSININGKNIYVIRMGVPVINPRTKEVVGNVSCLLDINEVQIMVEKFIREYEEIAAMSIYTNSGSVLADIMVGSIGKNMTEVETLYGEYFQDANYAVLNGREFQCSSYSQLLQTNLKIAIKPFTIGNSDTTWSVMIASTEAYILKDVDAMIRFTIILAVMALLFAVIIIYVALETMLQNQ
jgi:methyl-accepting chemotaxis protein